MKRSSSLPRVRRKAKPIPTGTKFRPWMLLALFGIFFFLGGMLFLMGLSPTDSRSEAVEIGHGSLSVTEPANQRKLISNSFGHKFAEIMVNNLSPTEPFTVFAPSDEAFFRMSSLFIKYPEDKSKVETILGRLVGYATVGRRLPAASLAVNGPERLESVVGFPLTVSRERILASDGSGGTISASDGTYKEFLVVNEERVIQEDLSFGGIVVHLMSDGLGPDEFLDAIRGTEPEDANMQEALQQEFGDSAATAGGQGQKREHEQQVRQKQGHQVTGNGQEAGATITGLGLGGDASTVAQGTQSLQDVTAAEEQKTLEVAADIDTQSSDEAKQAEQESTTMAKRQDELEQHNRSEQLTVVEVAEKLKKGVVSEDETAVATGVVSTSLDSDDRNRDLFVKEGLELLEKPGESGGEQREQAEAKADAEAAVAGDQKGQADDQGGGAGWSKQEFGLTGIGWWYRKSPAKVSPDQSGGSMGLGWLGFGTQTHTNSNAGDASDKANTSDSAVSAANESDTGAAQGEGDFVLGPDLVDNLPMLLKHPAIEEEEDQRDVTNKDKEGNAQGVSGVAGETRGGLTTSRSGGNSSQAEQESPPPPVYCNNRGFVDKNGRCHCAVLFAGRDCEKIADTSKLAIEPHIGPLAWSRSTVASKTPVKAPAVLAGADSSRKVPRQPQHLHPMTMRLLEEISKEERDELERALPQFDPLADQAWESCAVVGNSGGLLLRDDGQEIDRHEMVMRFNGAPTVGYEKQVGSKTTHRLSEVEWVGFVERNETVAYHLWLRAQKEELHHLLRFKHVLPDTPPFTILDLGFSAQILRTLGSIPSSGLVGISFAMQKCKRVDLYGFGLTEKHGVRHHYFNINSTVKGVQKGVEGLDKEFEAILDLADAELLWIADPCLYDCRRSMQKCSMCMRLPVDELSERTEPSEQQAALNKRRDQRWKMFMRWQSIEKEMKFRREAAESKRQSLARRNRTAAHKRDDDDLGSDNQADIVEWGRLIEEDRLEELPLSVLLTYFRIHHVTIPDTKKQMLLSIKSHYYFSHGQLHKQTNRLYRPSD